ncbi:Branched-chain amino acid transport system / permease component [Devosia equisanguinis]|uniref:Branched-chain amino acid transport system / permease component n=1 Tax=Devosia equisanguinis TaxID=2490941 RepID=A0A447IC52_9HYPH|nr:ABC transporter permease [Devosia equisanguinis]VDS05037.1 Branched-chain amino acid transport system / permease component [Devosia equisanguinis]
MSFVSSYINLVPVTFAQSLIYSFLVLGIMIPFRLISFPDLTSEGAFPLGGCVCAALILAGYNPILATLVAVAAGGLAGASTAIIHLRFGINSLLAGILVFTGLYSINLRILGKSNAALFNADNIFNMIHPGIVTTVWMQILVFGVLVVALLLALRWFLTTQAGAALRVVGVNPDLAPSLGINLWTYTIVGLALANAMTALGGALIVQLQGYADVGMGLGVLINGLASLVIGETIVGRHTVTRQLLAPVLGAAVYYQLVSLGLSIGLQPSDLKLATAIFVLVTLALPSATGKRFQTREKMRA